MFMNVHDPSQAERELPRNRSHSLSPTRWIPTLLLILALIFHSGSAHAKDFPTVSAVVLLLVLAALVFSALRGRDIQELIRHSSLSVRGWFLSALVFSSGVNMLFWGEYSMWLWYASQAAAVGAGLLITKLVPYDRFAPAFTQVMVTISFVTCIGWVFSEQLIAYAPLRVFESPAFDYRSFGLLVFNALDPSRSIGPFREPGVLAAYLIFAMLMVVDSRSRWRVPQLLVLSLTLLLTGSTAGYLTFALVVPYMLISRIGFRFSFFAAAIVLVSLYILATSESALRSAIRAVNPGVVAKIDDPNISTTTRLYGGTLDMMVALQYPFGIGPHQLSDALQQASLVTGYQVDARTNTFTTVFIMWGILCGAIYAFIVLAASLSKHRSLPQNALFLSIIVLTLSVQPHFGFLATHTLIFYWYDTSALRRDPRTANGALRKGSEYPFKYGSTAVATKRQLGMDSSSSSQTPSADGPRLRQLRANQVLRGRPQGHPGHFPAIILPAPIASLSGSLEIK